MLHCPTRIMGASIMPEPMRSPCIRYTYFRLKREPEILRPCLIQSDSASRKRPFRTGLFFDWILLVLLIVSRVDFIVFVLFLETVGVREYCCMAVENRLAVLCFARSPRATRASRATNLRPSGLVALGLAESRKCDVPVTCHILCASRSCAFLV